MSPQNYVEIFEKCFGKNQYSKFHVMGILNQDISPLCPTFDVNTPIPNPIDLSSYPSSNYNWWMKLLVALFSILLRPYSYIQIPSLSNTYSHTIRLSSSLNATISHPYNTLYHNSIHFVFSNSKWENIPQQMVPKLVWYFQ